MTTRVIFQPTTMVIVMLGTVKKEHLYEVC